MTSKSSGVRCASSVVVLDLAESFAFKIILYGPSDVEDGIIGEGVETEAYRQGWRSAIEEMAQMLGIGGQR